jgi:cyclomaltodextrin glucanotransferase
MEPAIMANETQPAEVAPEDILETLETSDLEFRGETIYFIVVDRFHDGNPANNAGPSPELFDASRSDWRKYWGGDLQGILDKLDYLQGLGVTTLWLTPLFEQIERMAWKSAPIHGYWTKDFKRINPRWVNSADEVRLFTKNDTVFDKLLAEMHNRKMKFVLDIVCNHSSPDAGGVKGQLFDDGKLVADFKNDVNSWYHHYGEVRNWEDEWQVLNCELAGLATFNENNIDYRNYIKGAIRGWLDKGVDALRVDTVKHMPLWFWQEFTTDMQTHKPEVFMFGEWIYNVPSDDKSVEFANKSGMSLLDFGLCQALREVLGKNDARGFPEVQAIFDQDHRYRNASELVTFIDNHDMPRFLSLGCDGEAMRLAIDLILTSRGIPCIYYGTEQYLHNDTDGGNDPYNRPMMDKWDLDTPLARDLKRLARLRRVNPAIQVGGQWPMLVTPDVYCYVRRYRDSRCFVAMNRGGPTTIPEVATGLPDGTHKCILTGTEVEVKGGKLVNLALGPKQVLVLNLIGQKVQGQTVVRVQLNGVQTQPGQQVVILGDCPELGNWDITKALPLEFVNGNSWFGEVAFNESAGRLVHYKFAVVQEGGKAPIWRENITSRGRVVASAGLAKWRDGWDS